jgi:hypothetical protein
VSTRSQTQRIPATTQKKVGESISSHPKKGSSVTELTNNKVKSGTSRVGAKWTSSEQATGPSRKGGPGQRRGEVGCLYTCSNSSSGKKVCFFYHMSCNLMHVWMPV